MAPWLWPDSDVNYREPAGDPGLFGPGSMAWRVHANAVALAVGGVAAVILELAEPRVRTGVWDHSGFRSDPLRRMQRTAEATLVTTFGPTEAAEARIARVTRMHERVSGVTPEGESYSALDPALLAWVHVTAGWGFLNAYDRYVRPLKPVEKDRYCAEGARAGRAFGVTKPPQSMAEVAAVLREMRPRLVAHPILQDFLRIVAAVSPLGQSGRGLQPLVVEAAIDLLPAELRRQLELPQASARLTAVRAVMPRLGRLAERLPPPAVRDARRRVGLAERRRSR